MTTLSMEGAVPPSRKPGVIIDVARFISASQDRSTGRVVFRFRDERGGWAAATCAALRGEWPGNQEGGDRRVASPRYKANAPNP